LALAVIIRRRFGIEKGERAWREEQVEKIQQAWNAELKGHFDVEEGLLFPEMEHYLGKIRLVEELLRDHASLHGLIELLEASSDYALLDGFGALLESHVHKEERQLFAEFEKKMPPEEARKLGTEIEARLRKACPNL
jgi:hemerythrin-like domain-containing protein